MPSEALDFTIVVHPELVPPDMIGTLLDKLSEFEPVLLDEVETQLQQWQFADFEDKGETFGKPWEPNSPGYDARKAAQGYSTEQGVRTTRMAAQIGEAVTLTSNSVGVGINLDAVPYAAWFDAKRVLVSVTSDQRTKLMTMLQEYIAETEGLDASAIEVVETL